jgi:hypothetical protein
MNEQDQRSMYTAFVLLGLLMRGTPVDAIPEITKHLVDNITKDNE